MKFVATKTADQLDLQALHRVRERLVSQRTGIINQIRAFLMERGIAVRHGQRFLRAELPRILATRHGRRYWDWRWLSKGRDFTAWLGLVPRQISTGDRTILGKILKRGVRYLRVLFVRRHGFVLVKVKPDKWKGHGLKPWIEAANKRLHRNVLAIALANKLARIAWSVLARGRAFEASKLQAALSFASSRELTRRGLREDETRWTFGLPGACEH